MRSQVEAGNHGKIVAIDIETGAFKVADNTIAATDRLYERYPNAQKILIRCDLSVLTFEKVLIRRGLNVLSLKKVLEDV